MEKQEKQKVQTHVPCQATPQTLPMGLNFFFWCFFGFLEVLAKLQKTMETPKKQKVQTHVPCHASPQTLPMGLNFFFVFFWFSRGFGQTAKNHGKTKKTKSSDPCPLPGLSPDLAHGSELFFFVFFLFFHVFFACFSCEDAFITVPLKKRAFLQFAHLRPPGQTAKKTWKNQN